LEEKTRTIFCQSIAKEKGGRRSIHLRMKGERTFFLSTSSNGKRAVGGKEGILEKKKLMRRKKTTPPSPSIS